MKISNEVKFGIFALLAIILFVVGMNYMRGSRLFGSPLVLYAEYDDVQNLIAGNPIKINGLRVGKVGELKLDLQAQKVRVKLEFHEDLEIPNNSEAMIVSADLLGSKEILIRRNDSIQATGFFQNGDTIRGTLEQGILDVAEDLVETRGTQILIEVGRLAAELNGILEVLGKALNDPRGRNAVTVMLQDLQASASNIKSLTSRIDSVAGTFNQVAVNANSFVGNLQAKNDDIQGIISNLRTTTDSLQGASSEIKQLMTDASSAMGSVENLVTKLDTTSGTLGLLLNDTQLYDSLTNTTENLNSLLREVKNNPHRFFDDLKIYLIERKPPKERKR